MTCLVDTSVVIEYLRNNQGVHERLRSLKASGLFISIISVAELYRGVFLSRNPERNETVLNDFLAGVTVLGFDQESARMFGMEDARLRRSGNPVGHLDLLIATTALRHGLTLLTADRDFERVNGLEVLYL
jgi:predicted nucleic acid-binding protein